MPKINRRDRSTFVDRDASDTSDGEARKLICLRSMSRDKTFDFRSKIPSSPFVPLEEKEKFMSEFNIGREKETRVNCTNNF